MCNFCSAYHHVRKIVGKLSIRRVRMWNFTRIGPKTKKLWLLIVPVQRPSEQPGLGPLQKGVNYNFSSPESNGIRKLSFSDALICRLSRIGQKVKNFSFFNFLAENLEKFRSPERKSAPLEGSTIFLYRSSLGSTAMESCQLAVWNMQFSAGQDVRLKNYRARSFYRWPWSMGS